MNEDLISTPQPKRKKSGAITTDDLNKKRLEQEKVKVESLDGKNKTKK